MRFGTATRRADALEVAQRHMLDDFRHLGLTLVEISRVLLLASPLILLTSPWPSLGADVGIIWAVVYVLVMAVPCALEILVAADLIYSVLRRPPQFTPSLRAIGSPPGVHTQNGRVRPVLTWIWEGNPMALPGLSIAMLAGALAPNAKPIGDTLASASAGAGRSISVLPGQFLVRLGKRIQRTAARRTDRAEVIDAG